MASFGEKGVPTVLVTGDEAAVQEAKNLIPEIEGTTVKWALSEREKLGALSVRRAVSLSPLKAQERIREAANRAMARVDSIKPFRIHSPFTLRVEYVQAEYAEAIAKTLV